MDKHGLVGTIVVAGILVVVGFFWFVGELDLGDVENRNCVADSCCHTSDCVWKDEAPDCSDIDCTANCEPGTMDCGAGHCEVVEGECGVVWSIGELNFDGEEEKNCVAASCCHADSCVWGDEAPDCSGVFCTMSCEPGTMDCGAGHCEVVEGACGVVWDE